MARKHHFFDRSRLLVLLGLLLGTGFVATTLSSYEVSKRAIREAIIRQELPLTSSNIYSEIQKDLVRPVLISSTMANDTFVRDWVLAGEKDVDAMARYLKEVKQRYGAFSSFFVSDRSANYYTGKGVLKRVAPNEPRDAWYYRVRAMSEPYEINVDPDLANRDALTIFINYRVLDFAGRHLGATGIGLTVDAVRHLIGNYQERFQRTIYFVDGRGRIVLFGNHSGQMETDIHDIAGLRDIADNILADKTGSYEYRNSGGTRLLNVTYLQELKWFLFVEKAEDGALADIRHTLYANLAICAVVTLVMLALTHLALARYQRRIEEMATTDKLTGLLNRQAFDVLIGQLLGECRREQRPFAALLVDIDHFKKINDTHGHHAGDRVLAAIARRLRTGLRGSDIAVRWGGEEFLLVLKNCGLDEAQAMAEKLRLEISQMCFEVDGGPVAMTISVGVAQYDGSELPDQTIRRADAGLYRAKNAGRNRVCVGTGPDRET
ncbi:MAG: sensor domain-containing diguanylate cyclase [Rhodocyclaceae bacterium]|nr:sensor domain-containing diguanylate cyclase [Rhodocyclaceae bacterium]